MDAVEFLNQVKRICNGIGSGSQLCSDCPLFYESGPMRCMANVVVYTSNDFDESVLVEKVEQWAKEHPKKTRQSEFLKLFPNAKMTNGALKIFPCAIDPSHEEHTGDCVGKDCGQCRREYWLEEIE